LDHGRGAELTSKTGVIDRSGRNGSPQRPIGVRLPSIIATLRRKPYER